MLEEDLTKHSQCITQKLKEILWEYQISNLHIQIALTLKLETGIQEMLSTIKQPIEMT